MRPIVNYPEPDAKALPPLLRLSPELLVRIAVLTRCEGVIHVRWIPGSYGGISSPSCDPTMNDHPPSQPRPLSAQDLIYQRKLPSFTERETSAAEDLQVYKKGWKSSTHGLSGVERIMALSETCRTLHESTRAVPHSASTWCFTDLRSFETHVDYLRAPVMLRDIIVRALTVDEVARHFSWARLSTHLRAPVSCPDLRRLTIVLPCDPVIALTELMSRIRITPDVEPSSGCTRPKLEQLILECRCKHEDAPTHSSCSLFQ